MDIPKKYSKLSVGFLIVLMLASIAAAITLPTAEASSSSGSQGWHGTTEADRDEYPSIPTLDTLPDGVTPDYTIETKAYLSFSPNPIGVGQLLLVNVWTSPGMYHAFYMQGYEVTIEKPDGTTETVSGDSYMADSTAWFNYIPDQTGTYRFKFTNPGTYIPAGSYVDSPTGGAFMALAGNYSLGASVYYTASETDWQNLTVQDDLVASYPAAALPTDYWSRPIYPDNREWYSIAGNYPFTGAVYYEDGTVLYASNYKYTAYVTAPNTAHIVWRRQGNLAGLIGGEQYQYSLSASAGTPTIIFDGRCYQTVSKSIMQTINGTEQLWPTSVWECYDLQTGQVYWDISGVTAPTFISYEASTSEAVPGAAASNGYSVYLVSVSGGRLIKYNPYTGSASVNVSIPVSSATVTYAPYALSLVNYGTTSSPNYHLINWTVEGSSTDFSSRVISNITWGQMAPYTQDGVTTYYNMTSIGSLDLDEGIAVYAWWATPPGPQWCIGHFLQAVDLKTGTTLWIDQTNDTTTENIQGAGFVLVNHGKVAFGAHGMAWSCWDARTGTKLWTSESTDYPWGSWFPYSVSSYDFNESCSAIITSTYEGIYAIDWDTGDILWHFQDPTIPFEDPYGGYAPFFTTITSADGKIYAYNGEHTASQPLTRNWKTFCLNATTGEEIWEITGPMTPGAVADGYLTASNSYDGYMYVFGKGQSSTTVSASPKTSSEGSEVLIEGTVMDMSPGDQGSFQNPEARLDSTSTAGTVPCVSASSMKTLMEYVYEQKPIDGIWHNETITGVPVTLTAIDENGNVIDIGSTTTNGYYGTFSLAWTPPHEGVYTVMASFAGDDSYGSSTAATALNVSPASEASPTATSSIPTDVVTTGTLVAYLVGGVIAIIVAIAIVGVLTYRKHQ
jgi:outer membrane protein assembly factor BamB